MTIAGRVADAQNLLDIMRISNKEPIPVKSAARLRSIVLLNQRYYANLIRYTIIVSALIHFLFKARDTLSKLSPVRDFSEQDKLKKSEVM